MIQDKLLVLAILILLNVNGICKGQTITIRYIGNSDVSIHLVYSFIELGNSTSTLNKTNPILSFESNNPQIIKCVDAYRNTAIYVEPNETIDIDIDNRGLLQYKSAKYSYRYFESQFINDCYLNNGPAEPIFIKKNLLSIQNKNIMSIKIDERYLNEKKLLDEYFANQKLSSRFYEYFKTIYWCLTLENKISNPKEQSIGFLELRKSFPNAENLINNYQYRTCLLAYCHYLMKNLKIKNDLNSSIQFITTHFSNQVIIDYLMYNRFKSHILNSNTRIDNKILAQFYERCKNKDFIADIKTDFDQKVSSKDIKSIIEESGCRLAIVDFWASWCKPCMEELPFAKKVMNEYPQIKYIFISIDKSKSDWLNATKIRPDIFRSTNSFIVTEINDKDILSKLKVTTIPRYILLDNNGQILDANLIRPSDSNFKKVIGKYLNK